MTALSAQARTVVEAFIAQLGLPARAASDGSYGLAFANLGTLSITAADEGRRLLVSLARRPPRLDAAQLQRALGLAGVDPTTSQLIHVGCTGDGSVHFALDLPAETLDLPALDACLQTLSQFHDRAA